jgi:hypothetical protein
MPASVEAAERDDLIRRFVAGADEPVPAGRIGAALPSAYRLSVPELRRELARLVETGQLHAWPGRRYASRPHAELLAERLLAAVARQGRLTRAEAGKVAGKTAVKVLQRLAEQGRLFLHPRLGRRGPAWQADPPDALEHARPLLDGVIETLQKKGFGREAALQAMARHAGAVPKRTDPSQAVLDAIAQLDPRTATGALVFLPHLRHALSDHFPDKLSFDRALLALLAQGRVELQSHPVPSQLNEAERASMIDNGRGSFYMAVGLRAA